MSADVIERKGVVVLEPEAPEAPAVEPNEAPPAVTRGGVLRIVRGFLSSAFFGMAITLAAWVTVPMAFGSHSLVVMSGSMTPALRTGDVVIDRKISPLEAKVGDIVTFRDPSAPSRLITHRVRSIEIRGDQVIFETKGDANNTVEHWTMSADGTIGRVAYHIPRPGYLIVWGWSRVGNVALVVSPALLLGVHQLVRIWRPRAKREDEEDKEEPADAEESAEGDEGSG